MAPNPFLSGKVEGSLLATSGEAALDFVAWLVPFTGSRGHEHWPPLFGYKRTRGEIPQTEVGEDLDFVYLFCFLNPE